MENPGRYTVDRPSKFAFKAGEDHPKVKAARLRRQQKGGVHVRYGNQRRCYVQIDRMDNAAKLLARRLSRHKIEQLVVELQHLLATMKPEDFGWLSEDLLGPDKPVDELPPPAEPMAIDYEPQLPSPLGGTMNPINAKVVLKQQAKEQAKLPATASRDCPYPVGSIPYLTWHQRNRPGYLTCGNCANYSKTGHCEARKERVAKWSCPCYGKHFNFRKSS